MSEEQDQSQKTEEPTEKRLKEAREKGQVALSKELGHWMMIFTILFLIFIVFPYSAKNITFQLKGFLEKAGDYVQDESMIAQGSLTILLKIGFYMALPFLFFVIGALVSPLMQNGLLWTTEPLMPKLERISLIKGAKRLFSLKSFMEFTKGILKLTIVGSVSFAILWPIFTSSSELVNLPITELLAYTHKNALKLLIGVLAIMSVIALADIFYERFEHNKQLKMTRQEIKDEFKQTEGNPEIKAKIRQIRSERARKRMMAEVPNADVVITNPTHFAIALRYEPNEMEAPIVVAKGQDLIAQKIKEIAKENNIPTIENKPLARALFATSELDEPIHPDHYQAVASIISYVFKLKHKKLH